MHQDAHEAVLVVAVLLLDGVRVRRLLALRLCLLTLLLRESLLRVGLHLKVHGKLEIVVELQLAHGVKVKLEALEVHNQRAWQRLYAAPHQRRDLAVALLAEVRVVALQHLALDVLLQRLLDVGPVLDVEADGVVGLVTLRDILALLADELRAHLAAPRALQQLLLRCALQVLLHFVAEHVEELVGVHLHEDVRRVAVVVLDGLTEVRRVVALLPRLLQEREQPLDLVGHIVCPRVLLSVGRHVEAQDGAPEVRHHEQLLHERVHVADAAQVADAGVAQRRALLGGRRVVPRTISVGRRQVVLVDKGNLLNVARLVGLHERSQ
mmetsp:Transcript_12009/g.48366  ORF Transcript_12009/g.48366 Transcript_12009/m.48366 type:complete len:323 (-) Transcript_12009:4031-4999(-)